MTWKFGSDGRTVAVACPRETNRVRLFPSNRRTLFQIIGLTAFVLAIWQSTSAHSADDFHVWTVPRLNDSKPWDSFVGGPKIRIEGRLAGSSGSQFRLQRCDAVFTAEKQKLQSIASKSYVEIKGQFKKDGSKLVFAVDELKTISSYVQQFDLRASRLLRPTTEDWITLAVWANELAKFYEDPELAQRASSAYAKAIDLEYRSLKPTNFEGRFELAKKMAEYELPNRRRLELVHEGCWIQWESLKRSDPPNVPEWQQFASTLNDRLPGAGEPLTSKIPELTEAYLREPDATYRKTTDELRPKLHRLFLIAITRRILLHDESDDGHNGDFIADEVEKLIPEEHALAETLRQKQLEFRLKHVATASRTEIESLANAFRARQQHETAKRALTEWIKAHESGLRSGGIVGLLELADEYLSLLNNRSAAIECLMEANKIDPAFDEVRSRLAALGYRWQDGRWINAEFDPRPTSDSQPVTAIKIGMSASHLRSLLGQPRSLARMITANGMTEVWSYGPVGTTPLVIRLERQGGDREAKVTVFSGE